MAHPRFELPDGKNPQLLIEALNNIEAAAKSRRLAMRVGWKHDLQWIKGLRNFRILWETGEVEVSHTNFRGELKMRYEDVLIKRQREEGRLMQIDVRPSVKRKGIGLDAMRKSSVGQVVLDHLVNNIDIETVKQCFLQDIIDFGCAGLGVWVQSSLHLGSAPILEVIHPWELLPLPVEPTRTSDVSGIMRDRWVTLNWLKAKAGLKFPGKDNLQKLNIKRILPGHRLPGDGDPGQMLSQGNSPLRANEGNNSEVMRTDEYVDWVYLREAWIEGEEGRCCRYIVKAGDWICLDLGEKELAIDGELPVMPITVGQYYDTGFYGRSFISPLIPLNRQQEKMAANLFQNVIDLDMYGIRLIPTTSGIKREALHNLGRNRYLMYEPDYGAWQIKPDQLTPTNMGDAPAKVIGLSHEMMDRISRESDMYSGQAPGRVDNARTMGILYETASIPLIPVTASIAKCFGRAYRAMLQEAGKLLKAGEGQNAQSIRLSVLDDATAGVVLDPASGEMMLGEDNPIPRPDEVIIDIRERMPRFAEKRKAEVDEALAAGKIDLLDYIIICLKENIDVPLGHQGMVDSVRSAWLENMILFGDGKTPGTIEQNDVADDHKVHLAIVEAFMKRPEWKLAAPAVKNKFVAHKNWHQNQLAQWAEFLPDPSVLGQLPPMMAEQLRATGQPMGPTPT